MPDSTWCVYPWRYATHWPSQEPGDESHWSYLEDVAAATNHRSNDASSPNAEKEEGAKPAPSWKVRRRLITRARISCKGLEKLRSTQKRHAEELQRVESAFYESDLSSSSSSEDEDDEVGDSDTESSNAAEQ